MSDKQTELDEGPGDRIFDKIMAAVREEGIVVSDEDQEAISVLVDCLVEMHEESQPITEEGDADGDEDDDEDAGEGAGHAQDQAESPG